MRSTAIALRVAALAVCLLAPTRLAAEAVPGWLSRLSVHGYLNQAYAVSDEYPIYGIPTGGTTDYRDVALQFRYDQSRRNSLLVQFRHERLGDQPRRNDAVELDWAFYQHRFSDRFALKAGRIPLPLGIYNETGGAAATSPFFRPPNEFYERRYSSKTLDGILGSAAFEGPEQWSFDVDGYAGRWQVDYGSGGGTADASNAYGAQVWANPPIEGLRFGSGVYRCTVEPPAGVPADYLMVHGSVEADLDRWRFGAEYLSGNLADYGTYRAWYAQAGVELTRKASVHLRGTVARITIPINGHSLSTRLARDVGLSLNYSVHHSLLFRVEGHTNEGLLREDLPRNLYAAPAETRYFIASVVASF